MKSDGMEWFLKYQVNVEDVVNAFPHTILHYLEPTDWHYFAIVVLLVVRGEKEEDAFMVLHIPGMIIRYNLKDYIFYKLGEFGNTSTNEDDNYQFGEKDEDCEVPVTLVSLELDNFRVHGQHNQNYYVYNPTTQQFATLPRPEGQRNTSRAVIGMKLAFDPWKWKNYKVVCIRLSDEVFPDYQHYQIKIYSFDTKKWRVLGPPFLARYDIGFTYTGVYWNGAIYWIYGDNPLRFNLEQEKLKKFPMPCIGRSWDDDQEVRVAYYGESCGYLHLVQVHSRQMLIFYNIYEMKSDSTEWYLKYQVNVEDVINTFLI
ncbi:hypothetical protein CQW23_14425 [Capsicum baccatum]|uniref:F-box associated beta-propeller type 3 domain-containing protein n=1 Tax=Capsicum baccatum TaxID=33114 RepID=A0A2G2WJ48_CAPBA|nr:hypothetical protein CQW23_14425 [Capsicum baccatum]